MMQTQEMQQIVNAITYKQGWQVNLITAESRPYVQITVDGICSVSKKPSVWCSGKTYLSPHMCRQEVVGAVFSAIERAEIHEIREWFRYKGASIFNPHLDPDVLVEVAKKATSFNVRANPMTMTEE